MAALLKMSAVFRAQAFFRNAYRPAYVAVFLIILIALVFGVLIPVFVSIMDGKLGKIAALPAALLFGLLMLYDRKLTLLLIMLFRSSADVFLTDTRFSVGGAEIGIGGLINACVILIAILLIFEKPKVVPESAYVMWGPFLLVVLLGVFISPVKPEAIRAFLTLLSYAAIFFTSYHFVRTREDFRFIIKLMVWSSVIPVLYGIADAVLHGGSANGPDGYRLQATFGHPNILAFYLTIIISLCFYLMKSLPVEKRGIRAMLIFYNFVLFGLLLLTKTRGAWIAMLISFTLYALIFERRYLIYFVVLGAVALFIPGVSDRLLDLEKGNEVTTYAKLNSFAWRVYLWQSALQWTTPTHYLFGNGLQSFKEYSSIFFPMAGKIQWGAHSVYVQWFFELGIAGIASYIWLHAGALRELRKMLKLEKLGAFFLIMIILNFLICAISDNMYEYLSFCWYLWFVVGAGCSLARFQATSRDAAPAVGQPAPGQTELGLAGRIRHR